MTAVAEIIPLALVAAVGGLVATMAFAYRSARTTTQVALRAATRSIREVQERAERRDQALANRTETLDLAVAASLTSVASLTDAVIQYRQGLADVGELLAQIARTGLATHQSLDHLGRGLVGLASTVSTIEKGRRAGEWASYVRRYLTSFVSTLERLPQGEQRQSLTCIADQYTSMLAVIEDTRHSSVSDEAFEAVTSISIASLRDMTIALADVSGALACRGEDPIFDAALRELEMQVGLQPILPKPGERVCPSLHEVGSPRGIRSEHPRGTVALVLAHGYRYEGRVFRPARVELSRGPADI